MVDLPCNTSGIQLCFYQSELNGKAMQGEKNRFQFYFGVYIPWDHEKKIQLNLQTTLNRQ